MRFTLPYRLLLLAGLGLLAVLASPAHAQDALQDEPGYVSPHIVEDWFDTRADTEVNLDGPLLKMVTEGLRSDEPSAATLLGKLKGIYVRRYLSTSTQPGTLDARTAQLLERLEAEGWQTVVRNREDGEQVNIFLKTRDDETLSGLVVLKTEPGAPDGEHVFVNIVGDISPQEVSKLSGSFGGLDSLNDLGGFSGGGSNDNDEDDTYDDRGGNGE